MTKTPYADTFTPLELEALESVYRAMCAVNAIDSDPSQPTTVQWHYQESMYGRLQMTLRKMLAGKIGRDMADSVIELLIDNGEDIKSQLVRLDAESDRENITRDAEQAERETASYDHVQDAIDDYNLKRSDWPKDSGYDEGLRDAEQAERETASYDHVQDAIDDYNLNH